MTKPTMTKSTATTPKITKADLTSASDPTSIRHAPTPSLQSPTSRCAHRTPTGRRCRSKCAAGDASFCARHANQAFRKAQRAAARAAARSARAANLQPPMQNFAPEILGPIKDFQTSAGINHVLGRLLVLLAGNRIPPRNAATIAYVCQLMLQSLPGVKDERSDVLDSEYMEKELYKVIESLPNLRPSLGSSKAVRT